MLPAFLNILGSTAAAQLMLLASTPVLMRHYDQASFGVFGIATALALTGSVIVSLRLDHSLHLAAEPQRLLGSCLQISVLFSSLLLLPVIVFCLVRADSTPLFALLFATSHAVWTSTLMFLNLRNRFRLIAYQNVLPVILFILGAWWAEALAIGNALLFWQAVAYLISALVGVWMIRHDVEFEPIGVLRRVLHRHRDDIRFLVPSRLLDIVSASMTVFGSAWLFGPELTGLVVVANRIARAPVRVLGNGMSNVLRSSIAQPHALPATFARIRMIAFASAVLAIAVVAILPEGAYARLFGEEWANIGPVLLITTVTAGFQLVAGSVLSLLATYAKRASFYISLALFAGGSVAIAMAGLIDLSLLSYLWLGCALSAIVYAASFHRSLVVMRRYHAVPADIPVR